MKFSSQEEFGLRCLLQIAAADARGESLTIPEISRREGLTQTHVAKLMMILRRGGLIQSTRGQNGGYALTRSPEAISVGQALTVLGGQLFDPSFCTRHAGTNKVCAHDVGCSVRSVWAKLQSTVDEILTGISIADLMSQNAAPSLTRQFDERDMVPLQMAGGDA